MELLHPLLIAGGSGAHLASSGSATPLGPSRSEPLCLIGCLPSAPSLQLMNRQLCFTFSELRNFLKKHKRHGFEQLHFRIPSSCHLGWMVGCFSLFACLFLLILFPLVGCFVDLLPQTLLVGAFPYTFLVQSFLAPSSTGGGLFVDARTHTYHTVLFSKDGGIFFGVKVLHWFRITGFFLHGFRIHPRNLT